MERCRGLSFPLRVAAPFTPPRRPISFMIWETVPLSFKSTGTGPGPAPVACATMDAANWLISCDSLRVRLGMRPVCAVMVPPVKTEENGKRQVVQAQLGRGLRCGKLKSGRGKRGVEYTQ